MQFTSESKIFSIGYRIWNNNLKELKKEELNRNFYNDIQSAEILMSISKINPHIPLPFSQPFSFIGVRVHRIFCIACDVNIYATHSFPRKEVYSQSNTCNSAQSQFYFYIFNVAMNRIISKLAVKK